MNELWQKIKDGLGKYIPAQYTDLVVEWMRTDRIHLHVVHGRKSKYGDYQPPSPRKQYHRISVNADLNPWEFLFTLAHEYAHLLTWKKSGRLEKPHGNEWRREFRALLIRIMNVGALPENLAHSVKCYVSSPLGSAKSEISLNLALNRYNGKDTPTLPLEEIPLHARFRLDDGRIFVKLRKIRTSYECISVVDKKKYRVSPLVRVIPENS